MQSTEQTISETLFEAYCQKHHVSYARIPTESNKRNPDYEVILQGKKVIVEVKQFGPTKEEKRLQRKLDKRGLGGPHCLDHFKTAKGVFLVQLGLDPYLGMWY